MNAEEIITQLVSLYPKISVKEMTVKSLEELKKKMIILYVLNKTDLIYVLDLNKCERETKETIVEFIGFTPNLRILCFHKKSTIYFTVFQQNVRAVLSRVLDDECPVCLQTCKEFQYCAKCSFGLCNKCFWQVEQCPQCRIRLAL